MHLFNNFKLNLIIIYICFFCAFLFSKSITIEITDKDLEIPLEGVKLYIKNTEQILYTDSEGKAVIVIDASDDRVLLTATMIGYESKKMNIKELDKPILIKMSISGVLESKELVVEEEAIGKTDEEVGISTVIDENQIKSTAEVGVFEDVISSVKTLPGVTYGGSFDSRLAVRGGHPSEFTTVLDGFIVRYPYHWSRAFTIYNPNIVDSVKFSNGIFSVKNGLAMSGLLEIDTVQPDEKTKFKVKISTQTVEAFLQSPVGLPNAGFYGGFRITFLDFPIYMIELLKDAGVVPEDGSDFSQPGYIRDGYLKWYWKPNDRFYWEFNSFYTSDGIGITFRDPNEDENEEIVSVFDFSWTNVNTFAFTKFKILPTDSIFIYYLLGYEFHLERRVGSFNDFGKKAYSKDFFETYFDASDDKYFELSSAKSSFNDMNYYHSMQTRLDIDFDLHEKVTLSTGIGMMADFEFYEDNGNIYTTAFDPVNFVLLYKSIPYSIDAKDKYTFKSFIYINTELKIIPDTLNIDIGTRLDHFYFQLSDGYHLNTIPAPGPRINITYTPIKDLKYLKTLNLSLGSGIFSKVPFEDTDITKEFGIEDFELPVPKTVFTVTGIELDFPYGLKFKFEGYYKYYFDNFYINYDETKIDKTEKYKMHSDGYGHVAGFDFLLQRKESRYIDGWISYSFVFARFMNPQTDGLETDNSINGVPTGSWFYPSYHRFHTLNIVLNIKPLPWFTIMTQFTFATGNPIREFSDAQSYLAYLDDINGEQLQMYRRSYNYSDSKRSFYSFPLMLKFLFHYFFPKRKIKYESYIAFENVLSFISSQLGTSSVTTDKFSGKDQMGPEANTNLPFPIPSFGIAISF